MQLSKQFSLVIERVSGHLSVPLFRNGYALVSSSFLSSAIGMFYWIAAARIYPANLVGLNSALISAMMLLGGIAQLNLTNVLIRFIPNAGQSTRRFVAFTYIIGPAVAAIISLVFLELLEDLSPTLGFLGSSLTMKLVFTLATMAWCIFVLEDGVLVGLRKATWVPVENSMFGLVKIVLLVMLASIIPQLGVFASWVIGLGIIIGPTTYYIFRRLIPGHMQIHTETHSLPGISTLVRYTAGDYIAALSWLACTTLIPIMVVSLAGTTANAYYYLPWQIALLLYAVSGSMGSSLIVEASTNPKELSQLSFRVLVQLMILVVPMAVVIIIGAPIILSLFGGSYAVHGTPVLRLLALSSIPFILTTVFVSSARVQRKISIAVITFLSLSILVIGLSYILLQRFGVIGVGYAWLGGQSIVAVAILFLWLRRSSLRAPSSSSAKTPMIRLRGISVLDPGNGKYPLRSILSRPWRLVEDWSRTRLAAKLIPRILKKINPSDLTVGEAPWGIHYLIQTQTDMAIFAVGPQTGQPAALIKLPLSEAAAISARHQYTAFEMIRSHPELSQLQALLPTQLSAGVVDGQAYLVEKMLPGLDGRQVLADPAHRYRVQTCAVDVITSLHEATARLQSIDNAVLVRWVDGPAAKIGRTVAQIPGGRRLLPNLDRLTGELKNKISGREVALSWVHGDFVPGNILVSSDNFGLTGIVDWELAHPADLPPMDIYQFILASRRELQRTEFGFLIRGLLGEQDFTPQERQLIKMNQERLPGELIDFWSMLLLFWLQHIHANLTKSTRYDRHWVWIYRNIVPVLGHFSR